MKKVYKISIILLSIVLVLTSVFIVCAATGVTKKYMNPSYLQLKNFGVIPDDDIDDTENLQQFIQLRGTAYLAEGTYYVSDTISLENRNLIGAGIGRTIIVARIKDKSKPIIEIGQRSSIEGFTIKYDDGYVTGKETEFERVALDGVGSHAWQNGASAKNIAIENVGTGILSRDSANTPDGKSASTFSVTFENIVFKDFSWKGLSFLNAYRTGNLYRSLTFLSSKYTPQSAMYLKGDESECNMINITVQDLQARQPIYFERIEAAIIENLKFNHVSAATSSILTWTSCSGEIENLFFDNCETENLPLINIGSTMMGDWDLLNSLKINNLTIKNMNSSASNHIIGRQENYSTDFFFGVENYSATGKWDDFPNLASKDNGLIITKKGKIRTEGSTSQRPTKCLCPYYSKYYDTDLQKLLVWTGKEWK